MDAQRVLVIALIVLAVAGVVVAVAGWIHLSRDKAAPAPADAGPQDAGPQEDS